MRTSCYNLLFVVQPLPSSLPSPLSSSYTFSLSHWKAEKGSRPSLESSQGTMSIFAAAAYCPLGFQQNEHVESCCKPCKAEFGEPFQSRGQLKRTQLKVLSMLSLGAACASVSVRSTYGHWKELQCSKIL